MSEDFDPSTTGEKMVQVVRNARGQFAKGSIANPAGRPRSARSKTTQIAEDMLAENAPVLVQHAINVALGEQGGPTLRALLPFLVAANRERPITFSLPELRQPSDALRALDSISAGIAAGELTDGEAKMLADLVGRFIEAFRIVDLNDRLLAVEQRVKDSQPKPPLSNR
jgi:hypothetical protein